MYFPGKPSEPNSEPGSCWPVLRLVCVQKSTHHIQVKDKRLRATFLPAMSMLWGHRGLALLHVASLPHITCSCPCPGLHMLTFHCPLLSSVRMATSSHFTDEETEAWMNLFDLGASGGRAGSQPSSPSCTSVLSAVLGSAELLSLFSVCF